MLLMHLFILYVLLSVFFLPPGVLGWLRLMIVALPGLFIELTVSVHM